MASNLVEAYKFVDAKIEAYKESIVNPNAKFNLAASQDAKESLREAYKAINERLLDKLGEHQDGTSCVQYDMILIEILDKERKGIEKSDTYLYQAVFLKLIQDAVGESEEPDQDPWLKKHKLLMYGWRCRLLSVLVDKMRTKFMAWRKDNATYQGLSALMKSLD